MKKQGLLGKVQAVLKIAYRFSKNHLASHEAMKGTYIKQFPEGITFGGQIAETLEISPYGNIYKVKRRIYDHGQVTHETTCLATYGWHSNGHLIEIGGYQYWIFDPCQGLLYVENVDIDDIKKVEIFKKIEE